jgi:hypothetical protein
MDDLPIAQLHAVSDIPDLFTTQFAIWRLTTGQEHDATAKTAGHTRLGHE